MNELSIKLERKDNSSQYKPRIYPGRNRGCGQRQNRYSSRERSYSRDRGLYNNSSRNRRCNEYDHFARECPNVMLDEEQIENLQMLLPEEQTEVLNYSKTDDLNL